MKHRLLDFLDDHQDDIIRWYFVAIVPVIMILVAIIVCLGDLQ